MTAAYAECGLWRGPNTLKYRNATPSIIPARANASTYCSPASLDVAYGDRGRGSTKLAGEQYVPRPSLPASSTCLDVAYGDRGRGSTDSVFGRTGASP